MQQETLEKTTDYLGNTVTNIYDELNQKVEVLDPYGKRITKTEYYPEQAMVKTLMPKQHYQLLQQKQPAGKNNNGKWSRN